jgi:hypothetical protein
MQIGEPAPQLDLQAVATGRRFDLGLYHDRTVLLIFVSAFEARSTRDVVIPIRQQFPEFNRLPIAIIINLKPVPKLLRTTVSSFMEAAYREAAADVPPGFNPADHLILLPDWTGAVTNKYGINHSKAGMYLLVIGRGNKLTGAFHGPEATNRAINLIRTINDAA